MSKTFHYDDTLGFVRRTLRYGNAPTIIESTIGQLNSDQAVNEANANTSNALDCVEERKKGEKLMYDELIKNLRVCSECDFGQNCNECTQESTDKFCCDELLHQAANAIEDLFTELRMEKVDNINLTGQLVEEHAKHQWISIKDRLPSQDGYYLVAYKLDVIPQRWHFNVYPFSLDLYNTDKFDFPRKKYKGKSGFYFYDSEYGYCEDSRATHWMPLPKPPKENEDG